MNGTDELRVFTGSAHPRLLDALCNFLDIQTGAVEVFQFSNENIFVRFRENIRHRDVVPVAAVRVAGEPEHHGTVDHGGRGETGVGGRITAVIPYFAYGRTDKKDQPRVPITARLLADLITVAGVDRVLTMDLHAGQIQGFFNIPVDELTALPLIAEYFQERTGRQVVVAPDVGSTKRARDLAERLELPLAIIEKRRAGDFAHAESLNVIGEVSGRDAILVDDEVDTGGSLASSARALIEHGANKVSAAAVHAVLSGPADERLSAAPIDELVVTDSLPSRDRDERVSGLPLTSVSVAPLLGEAIRRIHEGRSIGEIFA